jgi:hypothetical protein
VREIRRAGRRLGYRGMLVVFGIATVTLLAASGTGSAHATRVIQFKGHGGKAPAAVPRHWSLDHVLDKLRILLPDHEPGRRELEDRYSLSRRGPVDTREGQHPRHRESGRRVCAGT